MLGLDDQIASLSGGGSVLVVILVAALLGLRHATDPDHLAAVATLVASRRDRVARSAARMGAFWGLGHATTLLLFGLPILLADSYLPEPLQRGAETAVAALIVFLAVRLLHRWRTGWFRPHEHEDGHRHRVRTPVGAYGIGLVAVLARRAFARASFDGRVVRALPGASALVILLVGVALTVRAVPGVV